MSFLKSGFIISFFTFISRIFGLIRELVIANFFGTNLFADCINIAFKFPNLFRRIFGEGALSAVFVPIYSSELEVSNKRASRFASEIFSMLFLFLLILTLLLVIFMPYIIWLIAPGFALNPEKFQLAILLCRITTPYMLFISVSALIGGIQNSHSKFAPFAFVPSILNIAIIIACFAKGEDTHKAKAISLGILFGGILQFLFMLFCSKLYQIKFGFVSLRKLSSDSFIFFRNLGPALIGNSVTQISLFISQAVASFAPGAISIMAYVDRIYQFPLSIIGICFATILLPRLSALHKTKKASEALDLQTSAMKLSLFLSIAAAGGIIALSDPIIYVIYERGAFTHQDTINVANTLSIFALGIPAFIVNKVVTPIFYARLDTKTPLKITVVTIIINLFFNILLIRDLKHYGIAIATLIAAWCNIALILFYLKKHNIKILNEKILLYIIKLLFSVILMMGSLYFLISKFEILIYSDSSIIKAISLLLFTIIGGVIFFLASIMVKAFDISDFRLLIRKKYGKSENS